MIMKRLRSMVTVLTVLSLIILVQCYLTGSASAAGSAHGAHEEEVTESGHGEGAHSDELPGEVPFDIPLKEIQKYIEPMNELNLFPCSDCHDVDWEADRERRELDEPHNEIPGAFQNHDSENRWCLDCHSEKKRDRLQLLNGELVKYEEYYRLCEQCHKRVYREWKVGVHGKRTGNWDGEKQMMHCAQCHNPHNPPFQPIKPEPSPRKPLEVSTTSAKANSSAESKH